MLILIIPIALMLMVWTVAEISTLDREVSLARGVLHERLGEEVAGAAARIVACEDEARVLGGVPAIGATDLGRAPGFDGSRQPWLGDAFEVRRPAGVAPSWRCRAPGARSLADCTDTNVGWERSFSTMDVSVLARAHGDAFAATARGVRDVATSMDVIHALYDLWTDGAAPTPTPVGTVDLETALGGATAGVAMRSPGGAVGAVRGLASIDLSDPATRRDTYGRVRTGESYRAITAWVEASERSAGGCRLVAPVLVRYARDGGVGVSVDLTRGVVEGHARLPAADRAVETFIRVGVQGVGPAVPRALGVADPALAEAVFGGRPSVRHSRGVPDPARMPVTASAADPSALWSATHRDLGVAMVRTAVRAWPAPLVRGVQRSALDDRFDDGCVSSPGAAPCAQPRIAGVYRVSGVLVQHGYAVDIGDPAQRGDVGVRAELPDLTVAGPDVSAGAFERAAGRFRWEPTGVCANAQAEWRCAAGDLHELRAAPVLDGDLRLAMSVVDAPSGFYARVEDEYGERVALAAPDDVQWGEVAGVLVGRPQVPGVPPGAHAWPGLWSASMPRVPGAVGDLAGYWSVAGRANVSTGVSASVGPPAVIRPVGGGLRSGEADGGDLPGALNLDDLLGPRFAGDDPLRRAQFGRGDLGGDNS